MQTERLRTQEVQNWRKRENDVNAEANKETRIEKRGLRERVHWPHSMQLAVTEGPVSMSVRLLVLRFAGLLIDPISPTHWSPLSGKEAGRQPKQANYRSSFLLTSPPALILSRPHRYSNRLTFYITACALSWSGMCRFLQCHWDASIQIKRKLLYFDGNYMIQFIPPC